MNLNKVMHVEDDGGRSRFCVSLKFKDRARYLNAL